jgi:hypothetical protein
VRDLKLIGDNLLGRGEPFFGSTAASTGKLIVRFASGLGIA